MHHQTHNVLKKMKFARLTTCALCLPLQSNAGFVNDNIHVTVNSGSSVYFLAFLVENSNSGLSGVEIKSNASNTWVEATQALALDGWQAFPVNGNFFNAPISIRLTTFDGNMLVGTDLITDFFPGSQFDFGQNFVPIQNVPTPSTLGY